VATVRPGSRGVIDPVGLDALIGQLSGDGYRVVGPTVRDGAVVYDEIASVADLPAGWTDEQDGGTYRLLPLPAAYDALASQPLGRGDHAPARR
jgi:sulfhydrogenase subunit beta (sulfur reductase)